MRTPPFDFPHPSISLRMTLSNVEEVRVVRFPFEGLRAVSQGRTVEPRLCGEYYFTVIPEEPKTSGKSPGLRRR